jgi:UTP--glucose-1-phosphate uridylyltransferase
LLGDDIVVNQKVPAIKQLCQVFNEVNSSVVGVQEVPKTDVSKYGIVKPINNINKSKRFSEIVDMIEKPSLAEAPSRLAVLGRYVLTPEIFPLLETQTPGSGGEIQLTDAIRRLLDTQKVYAYNFEGHRYDVGNKLGYLEATVDFALAREDLKDEFMELLKKKVNISVRETIK